MNNKHSFVVVNTVLVVLKEKIPQNEYEKTHFIYDVVVVVQGVPGQKHKLSVVTQNVKQYCDDCEF